MSNTPPGSEQAVAELYRQFLRNPETIEPGWQGVFANLDITNQGRRVVDGNVLVPTAPVSAPFRPVKQVFNHRVNAVMLFPGILPAAMMQLD